MPILAAEPDLHPETLFETADQSPGWWVAQTKPRQEKCLARDLLVYDLPYYLPCTARRNRIRGRIVVSHIPLFSGYLFVRGGFQDKSRLLSTGRILRLIRVTDETQLVNDLKQVRYLSGLGLPLEPLTQFTAGETVRIRRGPMSGLKGSILRTAGGNRFVVSVEFLGQGVAVELDDLTLAREPLHRGGPR